MRDLTRRMTDEQPPWRRDTAVARRPIRPYGTMTDDLRPAPVLDRKIFRRVSRLRGRPVREPSVCGASSPSTRRPSAGPGRWPGRPVGRSSALARTHTTVSVERAVLRLAGVQGADADGIPWVNRLVDAVRDEVGLEHGVALPVWDALRRGESGGPAPTP